MLVSTPELQKEAALNRNIKHPYDRYEAQWPWCFQFSLDWFKSYLSERTRICPSVLEPRCQKPDDGTRRSTRFYSRTGAVWSSGLNTFLTFWSTLKLFKLMFLGCVVVRVIAECKWNEWFTSNRIPMLCAKDSGIARGQTLQVGRKKCLA